MAFAECQQASRTVPFRSPHLPHKTSRPIWARAGLLCLSALIAAGCGGGDDEAAGSSKPDRGDFVTDWERGGSELAMTLRKERLFEDVADALNDSLKLPRDLPIVHLSCGEENAFYDPNAGELHMCYELLDQVAQVSLDISEDEEELGKRIVGTWMFVFFHELGHGLVDQYKLPTTGKEEDVVDEFSTLLMIQTDLAEYAIYAADYWRLTDTGMYDESQFADEHSLNPQRFYNIMCLVYGSNPKKYAGAIEAGLLTEARAAGCPAEYKRKSDAWDTLLEPWVKE